MRWFKNNKSGDHADQERLAVILAQWIIKWQCSMADRLNRRANSCPRSTQLRWFWISCLIGILLISSSLYLTNTRRLMPMIHASTPPNHIGQRSEGVTSKNKQQQTDSLTNKKQSNGNINGK